VSALARRAGEEVASTNGIKAVVGGTAAEEEVAFGT
jgi:hypothetical protein